IETRFIEVNNSDVKNIGVNWASLRDYTIGVGPSSQTYARSKDRDRVNALTNLTSLVDTVSTSRVTSSVFNAEQFQFVIGALTEQGNSRLISNPTVVTLNNQEAYISVGE